MLSSGPVDESGIFARPCSARADEKSLEACAPDAMHQVFVPSSSQCLAGAIGGIATLAKETTLHQNLTLKKVERSEITRVRDAFWRFAASPGCAKLRSGNV